MSRKQNRINRSHHRRCSFEALENRRLLAGNVEVTLVGGTLSITGDASANGVAIAVVSGGTAGTVSGFDLGGSATTLVDENGTPIAGNTFNFTSPITRLNVDMKGGNDNLTIDRLTVNGKATIKLGSGDDSFFFKNTTVTGKLQIHRGKGHDTIRQGTGNNIVKVKSNANATASITGLTTTPEGALYTLNLSATPKNKKDVVTQWSIDWGDGSAAQIVNGNPPTVTHRYAVAGDYIITATATIAKKGNRNDTFQVDAELNITVENVPSSIALTAPGPLNENGTLALAGSFTDPGVTQGHRITVNWDDPNDTADSVFDIDATNVAGLSGTTFDSTGGDSATLTVNSVNTSTGLVNFTLSHQYLDDGDAPGNGSTSDTANIQVTVEDFAEADPALFTSSLSSFSNSTNVTINNVVPTVVVNPITSIAEAGTATVTGSFTDVGSLDAHTLTINWGDGTQSVFTIPATGTPLTSGQTILQSVGSTATSATLTIGATLNTTTGFVPFSVQHTYANNGLNTVQITVSDDDGGSNSSSSVLNVANVAPTATVVAPSPVAENQVMTIQGTFTDVGVADTHTVTVNWGDPNNSANSVFSLGATNTLTNGQTFTSTGADTTTTLAIQGTPTAGGLVTFNISHKYVDDGIAPGNGTASDTSTIAITVNDPDGASATKTTTSTITNAVPTVDLNNTAPTPNAGTAFTLTGNTFTDIGLRDAHVLQAAWGDTAGTTSSFNIPTTSTLIVNQVIPSQVPGDTSSMKITSVNTTTGVVGFELTHTYPAAIPAAGATITATVTDDDSGSGTDTLAGVIVAPVVVP